MGVFAGIDPAAPGDRAAVVLVDADGSIVPMTDPIDLADEAQARMVLQVFYDYDAVSSDTFDARYPGIIDRLRDTLITRDLARGRDRTWEAQFTSDAAVITGAARVALAQLRWVDGSSPSLGASHLRA